MSPKRTPIVIDLDRSGVRVVLVTGELLAEEN